MDYIVNLEYPNDTCTSLLLHNMRIKNKIRHSNSAHVDYTKEFSRVNVAEMNELDIQLYNFANVLIGVDCTFNGDGECKRRVELRSRASLVLLRSNKKYVSSC